MQEEQLNEDEYAWSSENSSECRDSDIFDMFRHQFEEEMGFNSKWENEFRVGDHSDAESNWDC